jgi:electron transfer flavoprotein beta subunit
VKILVCIKRVAGPGATIPIGLDGTTIDASGLQQTIGPHDESAVAIAVRLAEETDGVVSAMCLGPPVADEQLRAALAVGVSRGFLVESTVSDPDAQQTARGLVSAIDAAERDLGSFDLILFGLESADGGGCQVGIRVAHGLDRPVVAGISHIALEDGHVIARRDGEVGSESFRLPMPAVITVGEGISLPRYPTLGGRLKAKNAQVEVTPAAMPGKLQHVVRLHQSPSAVRHTEILTDAPAVVRVLQQIGIL